MSNSVIKTALGSNLERIATDSTWEDPEAIKTSENAVALNKNCQKLRVYTTNFLVTVELLVDRVIHPPNDFSI
jgi:hypothetical protein